MFKKIIAGLVAVAVVGFLGYTHRDQIQSRLGCADKVAHQFTTRMAVKGAYECLDPDTKLILEFSAGITDGDGLAGAIGNDHASYSYLGSTNDGGYTYRIDIAYDPHNPVPAAFGDLKSLNFKGAWAEVNGETQQWVSEVMTIYLYPPGTHVVALDGKTYDVSGELAAIQ